MFFKKRLEKKREKYNYYQSVKIKSDQMYDEVIGYRVEKDSPLEAILKAKLYNLVLNICNQVVNDYTYTFTNDDFDFIIEYNINLEDIIQRFRDDVIKEITLNPREGVEYGLGD